MIMNADYIINNIFPMESAANHELVFVTKKTGSAFLGLDLKLLDGQIFIESIDEGSPFHDTKLQVGQKLQSINNQVVTSCAQAIELIESIPVGGTLAWVVAKSNPFQHPCLYVTTMSVHSETSPVNFGATRGGSMVKISHVLEKGESKVHVGDIVLAVNNIVVTHPMAAQELMLQSARASHSPMTLYCVDMNALFVELLRRYPQITHHILGDVKLERCSYPDESFGMKYKLRVTHQHFRGPIITKLNVNNESLHLEDHQEYRHLVVQTNEAYFANHAPVVFQGSYTDIVQPFLRKFNLFLERELNQLETVVIKQVWQQQLREQLAANQSSF